MRPAAVAGGGEKSVRRRTQAAIALVGAAAFDSRSDRARWPRLRRRSASIFEMGPRPAGVGPAAPQDARLLLPRASRNPDSFRVDGVDALLRPIMDEGRVAAAVRVDRLTLTHRQVDLSPRSLRRSAFRAAGRPT